MSSKNDKKILGQLKSRFNRNVKWNKYRSQMNIQSNNNNVNCLIDPTFAKVTRLFVLSLARNAEGGCRDFKKFFKIIGMSRNNDYTTVNLLVFAYFRENYRLITIDFSKQTKSKDPQQISFIGKIEGQDNEATIFFIIEKSEETTFEFLQNSINVL